MSTVEIIVIAVAGAIGLFALIYGFFRKLSRISWIGWQVLVLFALTFLFDVITPSEEDWYFWVCAGVFAGAVGLVLLAGGLLRSCMMRHELPSKSGVWWSRIFGALCALINAALLFAVLASPVLAVLGALPNPPEFVAPLLESDIWAEFLSKHIYDLFIIAFCFVFVRAGLRVGLIQAIYYLLMFALTFAAFFGAILLATKVGVFAGWGDSLAEKFGTLPPAGASILGHGVFALVFFIVLFAVVLVIGWLLHKGLRRALDCRVVGLISSIILFLLFLAVFLVVMCGIYYGVAYIVREVTQQFEFMGEYAIGELLEGLLTSSPLSAVFYRYNPLLSIMG